MTSGVRSAGSRHIGLVARHGEAIDRTACSTQTGHCAGGSSRRRVSLLRPETAMGVARFASLSLSLALSSSRRRLLTGFVSGVLAAPRAAAAQATLTFDPATGTGVIDSGSVLFALGWDAQRLQDEAKALGFILAEKVDYTGVCSTGGNVSTIARTDTILENTVQYEGATVTGFTLTGKGNQIQWQDAT